MQRLAFPSTPAQWAHFLGGCGVRPKVAAEWAEPYAAECLPERFRRGVDELDDYIAEALHETAMLTATVEDLANYSPARIRELGALYGHGSRWARAAASADALAGDAQALAEVLYGGRFGNKNPGDGYLYRGRGIPMITFYDNYARVGDLMGQDLTAVPDLLAQRRYAVQASLYWWADKIPDSAIDYPERVRVLVQGSTLGLDHTRKLSALARANLPPEVLA